MTYVSASSCTKKNWNTDQNANKTFSICVLYIFYTILHWSSKCQLLFLILERNDFQPFHLSLPIPRRTRNPVFIPFTPRIISVWDTIWNLYVAFFALRYYLIFFPSSLGIYNHSHVGILSSVYPSLGITLKMFSCLLGKCFLYHIST